jgi:integrase
MRGPIGDSARASATKRASAISRAKLPCTIELMKVSNLVVKFYEFGQYKRLVEAADRYDVRSLVMVLLGGDAGLRMGEILALRWCDVDFRRKQISVQQAI